MHIHTLKIYKARLKQATNKNIVIDNSINV